MATRSLILFLCAGCAPPLVDQPWLIDAPRVVAVTAEPPEAPPSAQVTLTAFIAGPAGPEAEALRWTRCETPRAFSQNESVNPDCVAMLHDAPADDAVTTVQLPADVCGRFGPDTLNEGVRPRDPDATGGSYQPVGVGLGEAASFVFVRLWCRPAGVSFGVAEAYALAARPNTNPGLVLSASIDGMPAGFDELTGGAEVQLLADWSSSPEETFALIDPATGALATQVERYDVSWFVTAGEVMNARSSTGLGRWRLPPGAGEGTLWAVLRDSRGGSAVRTTPVRWQ